MGYIQKKMDKKVIHQDCFIEGKCFICGENCKEGHYVHKECALAYVKKSDEMRKKRKDSKIWE